MCNECEQLKEQVTSLRIRLGAVEERARRDAAVHALQIEATIEHREMERDLDREMVDEWRVRAQEAERMESILRSDVEDYEATIAKKNKQIKELQAVVRGMVKASRDLREKLGLPPDDPQKPKPAKTPRRRFKRNNKEVQP